MATKIKKTAKKVVAKAKSSATPEQKEAAKWAKFVIEKGVTMPFFSVDGHVRRTSDGKAYSSIEEFNADGGNINNMSNTDGVVI